MARRPSWGAGFDLSRRWWSQRTGSALRPRAQVSSVGSICVLRVGCPGEVLVPGRGIVTIIMGIAGALGDVDSPVSLGPMGPAFGGADADAGQVGQHRGGQLRGQGEAPGVASAVASMPCDQPPRLQARGSGDHLALPGLLLRQVASGRLLVVLGRLRIAQHLARSRGCGSAGPAAISMQNFTVVSDAIPLTFSCNRWWSRSLRRRSSCRPGASWCRRSGRAARRPSGPAETR